MTSGHTTQGVRERVEAVYQTESRRIFATLVRLLGDFDLAEDALHDAFRAAMEQWPRGGPIEVRHIMELDPALKSS
jgi:RNA polymerase sigma-70 factor (ECF subfamily)